MKISPFILVATTLIAAPAFAQSDACHDRYSQCVDRCGSGPQNAQDSCSSSCEAAANQCYSQMYSQPPGSQVAPPAEAEEAHGEAPKPKKKPAARSKKPL